MPEKIGRFEILSEIAHSESARVYKAFDPEANQTIALKVFHPELAPEQAAALEQRVLEEAEATKALSSHNIALLYGAGEIEGQFCAAVEYIQGKSVASMLAQQDSFSMWDLLDIIRQTCQALDHAHARRVLHYTLEPAKVLVSWDGTVKILGFGISTMGVFAAQASGQVPESLRYMSPEQIQGDPLDSRSNLFSLGAILYEMVTGRKAFVGTDAEQVRQEITVGMPVAPIDTNPKIYPELSALVMKALAKSPEQRYQSGQELVRDLEQCKENAQKPAPPRKMPQAAVAPGDNEMAQSAASEEHARMRLKASAAAAGARTGTQSGADSARHATMFAAVSVPEKEKEASPAHPPAPAPEVRGNGGKRPSFSEIDSLPPLKEVYVEPSSPDPEPPPQIPSQAAGPSTVFSGPLEEADKTSASELAKKVVAEIRKTPPKLFLYSIGAAACVILLVLGVIFSRIRSESPDETAAPVRAAVSQNMQEPSSGQPQAGGAATSITRPQPAAPTPDVISVKPKRVHPRMARVATSPAPVIVPGQLTINSTPEGAQVLVDGHHNPTWITPFDLGGLPPGQHIVSLSKPGYVSQTRTIDVTSGSKSFLMTQLAVLSATALISSVPPGAQVFLDGRATGRVTPAQMQVDKAGDHIFTVRKQGYLEDSTTTNLQPGQSFQYAPVLRELGVTQDIKLGGGRFKRIFGGGDTAGMGTVSVKTQPKGAQVSVNGHVLDKGSPVDFYLNPGTYIIDITLSGHKNARRVINVDRNGKIAIDETLESE